MKKLLVLLIVVVFSGMFAIAQENPRGELFGGFQYMSFQAGSSISNRVSINGWNADIGVNVTKNFALIGDFGGVYKDPLSVYTFMVGPRFQGGKKVSPFVETLFGGTKFAQTLPDGTSRSSQTYFSFAFGGGVDVQATNRIALRIIRLDYLGIRGNGATINNVRITPGIVIRF